MLTFYQVSARLLTAVKAELTDVPGRACVVPGAIAWDDCNCDGGQLAISLNRIFASDSFPTEITVPISGGCDAAYLVGEITVQVIRCAPQPQGEALSPTCTVLDTTAQLIMADALTIFNAVECELRDEYDANEIADYIVRQSVIVGPEGGCVGSELFTQIGLLR